MAIDQLRVDNFIAWGDAIENLDERERKYSSALDVADQLGLDRRLIESRLRDIRLARAQLPILLPAGATARILTISRGADGAVTEMDVTVEVGGKVLPGLASKDFRAIRNASEAGPVHATEQDVGQPRSVHVAILLDESPSTSHLRGAIHSATMSMVSRMPQGINLRLVKFAERAEFSTPWTTDREQIRQALASPFQGNGTALRASIAAATADLAGQKGSRFLVVFTDGKDMSSNQAGVNTLADQCRAAGVRVLAVGLASAELDESLLVNLAKATKGLYYRAAKQEELFDRFSRLKIHVSRSGYRLRFATPVVPPFLLLIGRDGTTVSLNVPAVGP